MTKKRNLSTYPLISWSLLIVNPNISTTLTWVGPSSLNSFLLCRAGCLSKRMLAYKAGCTGLSDGFSAHLGPAGAAAPHSEPLPMCVNGET